MINGKRTVAIIPARYASTRFPGKPLIDLNGKSMLERVAGAAKSSIYIDEVFIATDDERIVKECKRIGVNAIMTPSELPSGTDRIIYALDKENISAHYIINVQGDEPLIKPEHLDSALERLDKSSADVATLCKKITSSDEALSPNVVKIALNSENIALYFSRSPIPYVRDLDFNEAVGKGYYLKHIGVYLYTKSALERFSKLEESMLEQTEKLEQLRLVGDGAKYLCVEISDELIAIDAPEDVEKVLTKLA